MIKYAIDIAIALATFLLLAAAAAWALLPAKYLPGNRARHFRIRLHLRLHPGKGFATVLALHLRWGRVAALRRSGRIRPSVPLWARLISPATHSVFLGRAHYGHGLRVPLIGNQRYKNLLNAPACRQGYGGAGRPARWPGAVSSVQPAFPWVRPRRRHGRGRRSGMWPGQEQGWREVTAWWCCWLAPLSS